MGARIRIGIAVAAALATLVVLPVAFAGGGSVLSGYGGQASPSVIQVKGSATATPAAKPTTASTSGTLPFTGTDLGWFALAGGALVAVGFAVRKLGSEKG